MNEEVISYVIKAAITVFGILALSYWVRTRDDQSSQRGLMDMYRYGGYMLVGGGIGILISAFVILNDLTPFPRMLIVIFLSVVGVVIGFWLANRFPNSLR